MADERKTAMRKAVTGNPGRTGKFRPGAFTREMTTGEGNTAENAYEAVRTYLFSVPLAAMYDDGSKKGAALNALNTLLAEYGRLREQLNTRQWWLDMQYLLADRDRLREQLDAEQVNGKRKFDQARRMFRRARLLQQQLDAARQALEALWDAAEPYATYRDGDLNAALHAARAALGVEINDGKEEDDEQG